MIRLFAKNPKSSKHQKVILWAAIILSTFYYILVMSTYGWQTQYIYVECDKNAKGYCVNPFYICSHPYDVTVEQTIDCSTAPDTEKICLENPYLCSEETMLPGTHLGNKPPQEILNLPYIVSTLLILGALGWYYQGYKEAKQNGD